jgi:hypothetical protein
MKTTLKFLLASLFLAGTGIAAADEGDHHDDHHDGHDHVKVIVVHKKPRHHYHPKPHSEVILKVGGDAHH